MDRIRHLIQEVHRRSIWQVLGIYLLGSWIAYQVIGTLYETLGLPDWVPGAAIVLFLVGLPLVLATAIVQEGAPRGERAPPQLGDSSLDPTLHPELYSVPALPTTVPEKPRLKRVLTWNRAISAGVLAFAVLSLGVTGFMACARSASDRARRGSPRTSLARASRSCSRTSARVAPIRCSPMR